MSQNATRHNRKSKRPEWARSSAHKASTPTDRKARNRARRERHDAGASYKGGLI